MHLGTDMVCDKAYDAFAIVWRQTFAGIDKTAREPIDPEPTVGIEHDLDDLGVFEEAARWPDRERCAACARHAKSLPD